ncbi:MAG TPA: hypothetical protein PKV27_05690 [Ilumatobacteraceae bacterium]|nr:hypothetical protein [Ilumatobacteraceae bacterium]
MAVLAATLSFGLAASSCATFDQNRVAEVGATKLSRTDLDAMLTSKLSHTLLGIDETNGAVDGEATRTLLTVWAQTQIVKQAIDTPLDTAATEQSTATQYGEDWQAAPQTLRDLVVDYAVINEQANAGTLDRQTVSEAIKNTTVYVDARIGTWDHTAGKVVAVG